MLLATIAFYVFASVLIAAALMVVSARNPVQAVRETLPNPAELTTRLLERTRELTSILEGLHEMVSNGDDS